MVSLRKSSNAFQNHSRSLEKIPLAPARNPRLLAPFLPVSNRNSPELEIAVTPSKQRMGVCSNRNGFGYLAILFFALIISVLAISLGSIFGLRRFQTPAPQSHHAQTPVDPWTPAQTVQPQELLKELASSHKPVVVCVGFHPLYDGAHVPGAVFHGSASTPEGLDDLKRWAQSLPRGVNLVAYCGCCPMTHCPNIRPAFEALRGMGFTRLRVLILPNDFATDWVARGYPIEKGK